MGLVVDIHAHAVVPDAQLLVRRERAALGGTGASVDPDLPPPRGSTASWISTPG
jgi:hypothetical protein